ncbi:GntR family transcriptional regulator [Tersicoccus solisilvae]|uniref:GntR family transcriptional regulator n=1 Tax=Tersicoccus solisilvae TaxID=1882339 RepID=A0ABQ1NZU4_9MICC|nr:GntR family transcriptional regulator [Tersicoccus solisilvae]GGC84053.1 GntR family transcriptional regulator [Tersicoccus solisilvae]
MGREPSLVDQAYQALKRDILQCRLKPGEVIIDARLAEMYGMSKTPIRQAINVLDREGLVVVVPRRGTFVKIVDFTEVQDVYRLRALLEPEAAVLASRRATAEELDELDELSEATVSVEADSTSRNEANRILHVRIAEVARVPILVRTVTALNEEIERFLNLRKELGKPYTAVNHGRIVDAIRGGDEAEIRTVVSAGIERARVHMLEAMLEGSTSSAGRAS